MITKNEALIDQFNSKKNEIDQKRMIIEAGEIWKDLMKIEKDNKVNIKNPIKDPNKGDSDLLASFKLIINSVTNYKSQLQEKKINISSIPNIEKYGNESIPKQNQSKSNPSNVMNLKSDMTPNPKKGNKSSTCSII